MPEGPFSQISAHIYIYGSLISTFQHLKCKKYNFHVTDLIADMSYVQKVFLSRHDSI